MIFPCFVFPVVKLGVFWQRCKTAAQQALAHLFLLASWRSVFASGPAKREQRLVKAAKTADRGRGNKTKNQHLIGDKPQRRIRSQELKRRLGVDEQAGINPR
jgi:hypothetical protein